MIGESAAGQESHVRVRELIVDGHLREYTAGQAHEITDRLFVIRKAQRLNDALPDESRQKQRWVWRLDGWISVDRQTGHVAQLTLPDFDPEISQANWYRDYAAYCGSSDDGGKIYVIVVQWGKRKPLLKKEVSAAALSDCSALKWERNPSRVTFAVGGEKSSFVVRARGADQQTEPNTEEGPQ